MSFVQDISGSAAVASGTTIVQAITGVVAGNLLRVVVGYKFTSSRTVSVSDGTHTYNSAMTFYDGSSNWGLCEFWLPGVPGGTNTLTATYSAGTTDQFIYIQERSGCISLDVAGTVLNSVPGAAGANAVLSNPITTTATDDLCGFCVLVNGTAPATTTGTTLAWVGRTANPWTPQGSNGLMASEDLSAQAASSYTATFGMSSAGGRYLTFITSYSSAVNLPCAFGAFSLAGKAAGLAITLLQASVGPFSLAGQAVTFQLVGTPLVLLAAPGVYNFSGASSLTNYEIDPSVGLFSISGQPASFGGSSIGLNLPVQQGGFSFVGNPAQLIFAGNSGGALVAQQAGFVVQGQNALLSVASLPPSSSGVLGRPGGRTIFSTKKVSEQVDFIWDFVSSLGPSETILQATLSAFTYMGNDTTPMSILGGPAVVSGTQVYQLILGGLTGQIYGVTCSITTSLGQTITMSAYMAIEPNLP